MALQKTVNLSSGVSADYFRLSAYRWDRGAREASAHFDLFLDAQAAAAGATPVREVVAKLRLTGAKFDQYLAASVLAASNNDVLAQLYTAAKAEPVISDYGEAVFADATNV